MQSIVAIHRPLTLMALCILGIMYVPYMQIPFAVGFCILFRDADCRLKEFFSLERMPQDSIERTKLIYKLRKSWCGRGVLIAHRPHFKRILRQSGYRWYHILPDGAPMVFFRRTFWKHALGI